jgi:hypothetical protein
MDPVTNAVVHAATAESAAALKKESDGFLKAVYGEPAKAFGGLIADKLNRRRHANLIKITVEAKRKLAEAGVSPKEVPLKIIHPALEAASLEEDPDLQVIWSALLANAADPRQARKVTAPFIPMLKEMTPATVKFLDALSPAVTPGATADPRPLTERTLSQVSLLVAYTSAGLSRRPELPYATMGDWDKYADELRLDFEDFHYLLDLLTRNGILRDSVSTPPIDLTPFIPTARRMNMPKKIAVKQETSYYFTHLGIAFMRACRQPG